jgi:DNA replication protein DnaC
MLNEPTYEKLLTLGLTAMAVTWKEQQNNADVRAMPFDDRFALLVDTEWLARENKRLKRRLAEAKLRLANACVEDIDFPPKRQLDKSVVRQLGTCRWVGEHQNVVVTGMAGTGKSYVACALAHQACLKGFRAIYRRVPRLFEELALAHADGTYVRLLQRLARVDVLVLDDFALSAPKDNERRDLLEVLEDRYGNRSTIITSQVPVDKWHDLLGEPTIADAILDRVVHNAHRVVLHGPSRRKEIGISGKG